MVVIKLYSQFCAQLFVNTALGTFPGPCRCTMYLSSPGDLLLDMTVWKTFLCAWTCFSSSYSILRLDSRDGFQVPGACGYFQSLYWIVLWKRQITLCSFSLSSISERKMEFSPRALLHQDPWEHCRHTDFQRRRAAFVTCRRQGKASNMRLSEEGWLFSFFFPPIGCRSLLCCFGDPWLLKGDAVRRRSQTLGSRAV